MDVCITPARLSGRVAAVASKSDAHRCLIAAALGDAPTAISLPEQSQDIGATVRCLRALGATIGWANGAALVTPGETPAAAALDCGESGSTLRFLLPVAAALGCAARFSGSGRLPRRPLEPLLSQMKAHGCAFDAFALPLALSGRLTPGRFELPGDVSSQYVTGLLLALPLLDGDSEIVLSSPLQSRGYVGMTLDTLRRFRVEVSRTDGGFFIAGGQTYRSPGRVAVQGDWSNAAFWLVAGAVSGPVTVSGLDFDAPQGDKEILKLLSRFGARVSVQGDCAAVSPAPLTGIEIDAADIPDLVPVLAAAACAARGRTVIRNAARLRLKESDRLSAMADALTALGAFVLLRPDGLEIEGGAPLSGGCADSRGDHRIAMAAAVAAALCGGDTVVKGADAVEKSYPRFFEDYAELGGRAHVL